MVLVLIASGQPTSGISDPDVAANASASAPHAAWGSQMANDPALGETILFGGSGGGVERSGVEYGRTWSYENGTWTDITPAGCSNATCPRLEAYGGLAYYHRGAHEYLVLYGGRTSSGYLTDSTWIFNGSWQNVTPARLTPYSNSPPPLNYVSMTWDPKDGYDLVYGGCTNGCSAKSPSAYETWAFEGLNKAGRAIWKNLTTATHPPSLYSEGLTYDAHDGYVLLFGGGMPGTTRYLNQTWTYTALTGWVNRTATVVTPGNTPPFVGIIPGQLQYDPAKGYVLLFGGQHFWANPTSGDKTANATINETWTFRGGKWTNISATRSPEPRFGAAMAYDVSNKALVLFGGLSGTEEDAPLLGDTWWFNGTWSDRTSS